MEKRVQIIKKGQDNSNYLYWLSLTPRERMSELEEIRNIINVKRYGTRQGFQRVYRITKRA